MYFLYYETKVGKTGELDLWGGKLALGQTGCSEVS